MSDLKLARNMQSASMCQDGLFELHPKVLGFDNKEFFVGTIVPLQKEPTECLVHVDPELREKVQAENLAGEVDIRFIQKKVDEWLAIFAASKKVESVYLRLSGKDILPTVE